MIIKNRLLDTEMIIYQNDEWFKFSLDSILLTKFVTINKRHKKILDMACGNAAIPMLLSYRTKALIYGIEIQKCVYDLGIRSIVENGLADRVKLICGDINCIGDYFSGDMFDVITCNPPYFKVGDNSFINRNDVKSLARHEITLNLDILLSRSYFLLKNGGIFAMVHRTERLVEILELFKKYHIEPKRIQFIYPKEGRDSDLFLIEGIKNGNSGIKMLSPLIVHNDDNSYTESLKDILKFD